MNKIHKVLFYLYMKFTKRRFKQIMEHDTFD